MRVISNLAYRVPHLGHSNRKCFHLGKHIQLCCPTEHAMGRMFPALWQDWSSMQTPTRGIWEIAIAYSPT